MLGALSLVVRVLLISALVFQVLAFLAFPRAAWRRLLPVWQRLHYGAGIQVSIRTLIAEASVQNDNRRVIELLRQAISTELASMSWALPYRFLQLAARLAWSGETVKAAEWFDLADRCTFDGYRYKTEILTGLATALAACGREEEARAALERASALDRNAAKGRITAALGYLAIQSQDFDQARLLYEQAQQFEGDPSLPAKLATLNNLAYAALRLGDLTAAERYVDQVNALAAGRVWPGQDYFLNTTGALRTAEGRFTEARAALTEALTLKQKWGKVTTSSLVLLAELALAEERNDAAAAYLELISVTPQEPDFRNRLAEVLDRLALVDGGARGLGPGQRRRLLAAELRARPQQPPPVDDPLLAKARLTLHGWTFGEAAGLSPAAAAFGAYLGALLAVALTILIPTVPDGVVLVAAGVLMVLLPAYGRLARWFMGPWRGSRPDW